MINILVITPLKHLLGVFEELKKYGNIIYLPYINKLELIDKLKDKNIEYLLTNPNKQGFILDKDVLENSNIKLINTCSTGTNHIDKEYCFKKNIKIWSLTNDYELINDLPSTSDLAFGLMINLLRNIPLSFQSVKNYNWNYEPFIGREIKNLNLGIIGFGRLGKIMSNYGKSFGMNILIYDPYVSNEKILKIDKNYKKVNKNELLELSDVISIHVHVNEETKNMINKDFINKMKNNSYLINTSRGEIVNEDDIINNLKNKKLGGYATDVLYHEFSNINNSKLIKLSNENKYNLIITPHIGGMTIEGQTKAYMWSVKKFNDLK